jgi:endonuclease/exonuclease/phosphatase family metal-dependent hydrolase
MSSAWIAALALSCAGQGPPAGGEPSTAVLEVELRTARELVLPDGLDLRVMSFNIRYGSAPDGVNHWDHRRENVLSTIGAQDPDLLGLQESLPFQSSFVAEFLPDHEFYGPGRLGPGKDEEACALFWRSERFELLEDDTFWLSPTPGEVASRGWDAALPRICTWARLRDRHTGHEFVFANTHFDHRGAEARLESAKLLAGRFPGERVLLIGDFNAAEDSAPIQALRAAGFVDSYRIQHPEAADVGTFTGFQDAPGASKIDYVFLRGAADVLAATIDRSRFDGRWPSDHFPVSATLRWR